MRNNYTVLLCIQADKHIYTISDLSVTSQRLQQEVILDFDYLLIEDLDFTLLRDEIVN